MFIGPHAEVGGEHKATAALFPHVIGVIQTAVGRATLERAGGISAQLVAGDPVCQGDVIETAADGEIGIRFIDGTVLNLSHDTRVALSEFVSDSSGASYSALFGVTSGTFAFVAGQAATTGSLRIETPFGSIRGRAHAAGVGMLSLAALVFSAMNEVQAADPNATFLDDDNITYKDFAHGKFELVTKEAIPRHIMVEDPGQTVVLSKTGSSVSVNQVTNTPARMEELQALQQDVLANFAKGVGPGGSSTPPPFGSPLPVQPINFVEPDGPAGLNSLSPIPVIPAVIQEVIIVRPPPPAPTAPTFTIAAGPVETDTVRFDTFAATSGTFSASSANNGALTFGISGGTAGSTVLGGVAFDVSDTGAFGTLFVDSTTGAYMFVPNSDAINALTEPTTQDFVVTVSDGTLSTNQTFTININGVNDAAIISGTTTASVIEAGSAPSDTLSATGAASSGPLGVTGKLTDTDVDNAPNTFTAVSSPTASHGGYGTFTMTADGVWTYTLDNANSRVQALNVNDTLTDSFTVTTADGTPQLVTIVIHGTNDAAIVSGAKTGTSTEAGGVANAASGTPIATGKLTDTDVDNTPDTFTAVSSPTASHGGYGTFTMTADGAWTYTLNNANSKVQALNVNDTLTDTFTVTTIDGTAQLVTVVIHGSNDAAVISGVTTGSVTEAADCKPGKPVATGTLTDTDIDNAPNTFTAVNLPKASTGGYGTFTMTADGCWTYTLDNTNHAVQALNVCDTLTDCFTVTTIDGTPQVVTITIHGTNDAAIIYGATTGSVTEAGGGTHGTPKATGTLTDTDVDNAPNTFTAVDCPTASDRGYGSFTMTADGVWTYTLDNAKSAIQALNDCDTLTDCFTVTTIDGTPQVVTITIHGNNDAAVISGVKTGSVTEAAGYKPGKPIATGTLTDTDIDNAPNAFTPVHSPKASTGGYGTFTMTSAGCWTYTLDNANHAVQALNDCDTLTDTFTVTTVDGTPQLVTISIHGTNDAAIIYGTTTGSVIEAGGGTYGTPKATGTLTDTDVDNAPNTFTAVDCPTVSDGGYGSFTMTTAGVWTYTLDNTNCVVQALNDCDTLTDCFTVTSIDGTAQVISITIHGASDADPNDFDYLATGRHVTSDPPYVYGTRGDDCIAGGGHYGQIIYSGAGDDTVNGTGRDDVIYAGSGDDTVKGNDGCDTIYGGSGRDTINGNNGDDTIIGGFGPDCLTGGNGNDRFVYLSAADSSGGRSDTITDFRSGCDRIDVTALGALALLALTSTSTSVPAHTIGWVYDSASNETVIYVNPTDHTLRIGNSSLVEIHLQGIATVQASDFVTDSTAAPAVAAGAVIEPALVAAADTDAAIVAMTTADTSFNLGGSNGAGLAAGSATAQATDIGLGFDAGREHAGSSAGLDEARPGSNGSSNEAVITQANAHPAEPHRAHVTASTEQNFAFAQTPLPGNAGKNGGITAPNAADDKAAPLPVDHSRTLVDSGIAPSHNDKNTVPSNNEDHGKDVGLGSAHDADVDPACGSCEHPNTHSITHSDASLSQDAGHSTPGEADKHDTAPLHDVSAHDVEPSWTARSWFDSGHDSARGHVHSFQFKDEISHLEASDVGLADGGHGPASNGHRGLAAGADGHQAISDETQTIEPSLPGHHGHDHFGIVPGHTGNAIFAQVHHDLMV